MRFVKKYHFRFNKASLYGSGANIVPDNEACPPVAELNEDMKYYDGNTQQTRDMSQAKYAGIDQRWHKDVGSCGSTISKNIDDDITIVKKLVYFNSDTRDGSEPIKLGSDIWLTGNEGRVAVTFTCKFASTFTAKSDEIEIEAGKAVEGKLEASGSWSDSLKLDYTDATYTTAVADGDSSGKNNIFLNRYRLEKAASRQTFFVRENFPARTILATNGQLSPVRNFFF